MILFRVQHINWLVVTFPVTQVLQNLDNYFIWTFYSCYFLGNTCTNTIPKSLLQSPQCKKDKENFKFKFCFWKLMITSTSTANERSGILQVSLPCVKTFPHQWQITKSWFNESSQVLLLFNFKLAYTWVWIFYDIFLAQWLEKFTYALILNFLTIIWW